MPGFVDVHSHVVPSGDDGAAHDRGGPRALPARLRGRHRDPVRDAARARALGPLPADGRARRASTPSRSRRCAARSPRWGLDLRRGWEVYPSEIAGERSRRPRARGHPRRADRVPGLVARHRGSDRARSPRRPSWSRRRGSCRCSPTRSAAAPSPPIPSACVRSPSGAGSCASTRRRSSAGTARPPSAPSWALLDAGLVALAASDGHSVARPPTLDAAYHAGARAPRRRDRAAAVRRQRPSLDASG